MYLVSLMVEDINRNVGDLAFESQFIRKGN